MSSLTRFNLPINNRSAVFGLIGIDQLVVSGGNFLTTVFAARGLGERAFGIFSASIWATLVVSSLMMASIVFPMMTEHPVIRREERSDYVSGNYGLFHRFSLLILCTAVLIEAIAPFLFSAFPQGVALATALCAVGVQFQELTRRVLMLENKLKYLVTSEALTYGLRLIFLLAFAYAGLLTANVALLTIGITAVIGSFFAWPMQPSFASGRAVTRDAWRANKPAATWLLPAGLMQWSSTNFYLLAAPFILTPVAIGHVRAAQSLATVTNPVIQAFDNVMPIKAAQILAESSESRMLGYLARGTVIGAVPLLMIIPLLYVGGDWLLLKLYGFTSPNLKFVLTVFCLTQALAFCLVPMRAALRALGYSKAIFVSYLFASAVSVVIAHYLISTRLALGVAIGMAVANVVLIAVSLFGIAIAARRKSHV